MIITLVRGIKYEGNDDYTSAVTSCPFSPSLCNSPHSWWPRPCRRASAPWEDGSWSRECRSVSAAPGGRWSCSLPSGGRLRSTAWKRGTACMRKDVALTNDEWREKPCCTHSTVNSWAPTGMQYTNCMALHRRWNSTHSSTCITPLLGNGPRQMGSSRKPRTRVRMTSNMDKPQHSLSLVSRSPSRAMAICWKESEAGFKSQIQICTFLCSYLVLVR